MTYREQFEAAMQCNTKEEADQFLESEMMRYYREYGIERPKALETVLANLGYMAGYFDDATAKKVKELFGAVHPVFGTSTYHTS